MVKLFYSLVNRTKIAVLLAVILVVVLAKNIWEKKNIENINQSFSSIYNDRLLPATYIFKITNHLYQKRLLLTEQKQDLAQINYHNNQIEALLTDFENTHLVAQEGLILSDFRKNLQHYNNQELSTITHKGRVNQTQLNDQFNQILNELEELSKIQTTIGNDLRKETNQIVANSSVLSGLEISILIILGLIIQILIFVSRTTLPKTAQKHQLN